jgi:hypothetical protein
MRFMRLHTRLAAVWEGSTFVPLNGEAFYVYSWQRRGDSFQGLPSVYKHGSRS